MAADPLSQLPLFAGIERRFERLCHFLLDWSTPYLAFQEQKSLSWTTILTWS
jgi:hypothetical protein